MNTIPQESGAGHTPGPWREGAHTRDPFYITSDAGIVASALVGYAAGSAQAQANARLIAAAPDLAEAAQEMLIAFAEGIDWSDPTKRAAYKKLDAALAKSGNLS